jgi:ADP-ribose pyrophosphatase YjhB (NUDIX family)
MTPSNLPKVSIDVVPLRVLDDGTVQVGLGVRAAEPFKGHHALPGVLLLGGELLQEAGFRALHSKTGLDVDNVRDMRQFATFDSPTRDPRGHTLSVALVAVIDNLFESEGLDWFGLDEVKDLPFDHESIITAAVKFVSDRLWEDVNLVFALLGQSFSTAFALKVTERLTGMPVDRGNFNRKLASSPFLQDTGFTDTAHAGKGRPSKIWSVTG